MGYVSEDQAPSPKCRALRAHEFAVQADERAWVAWERAERAQAYLDVAEAAMNAREALPAAGPESLQELGEVG